MVSQYDWSRVPVEMGKTAGLTWRCSVFCRGCRVAGANSLVLAKKLGLRAEEPGARTPAYAFGHSNGNESRGIARSMQLRHRSSGPCRWSAISDRQISSAKCRNSSKVMRQCCWTFSMSLFCAVKRREWADMCPISRRCGSACFAFLDKLQEVSDKAAEMRSVS